MNNEIEPTQQADGYSLEEIAGYPVTVERLDTDDDPELVEELADTVTIEKLLDTFIEEVSDILGLSVEVSLEGNPVRTHLELVNASQDIVELAYELRQELLTKVANRAEAIAEQNFSATQIAAATHPSELRKQVIPEEEN
jgi:DNA mismatch repair ATPase MutS